MSHNRATFEDKFPVPEHVVWNPEWCGKGRYEPDNPLLNPKASSDAFAQHQRWIGWQAFASASFENDETVAWIRPTSTGGFEGPLHDCQIDDVRKRSGAWSPLHFSVPKAVIEDHRRQAFHQGQTELMEQFCQVINGLLDGDLKERYGLLEPWASTHEKLKAHLSSEPGVDITHKAERYDEILEQSKSLGFDDVTMALDAFLKLSSTSVPNERGTNRYGLDMAYFRGLFNRELNIRLSDYKPHELARMLARAAKTADETVLREPEFSTGAPEFEPEATAMILNGIQWYRDMDCLGDLPDEMLELVVGNKVSIDVSTGEDDACNRVFGDIVEWQDEGPDGGRVWLCTLDQFNYTTDAPKAWRDIIKELADNLESEIESRRSSELARRIERDLIVVKEARALLDANAGVTAVVDGHPKIDPRGLAYKALELCNAVENKEEFSPSKFALRCLMLVNQVRKLAATAVTESVDWIKCSEQMPTGKDADYFGKVFAYSEEEDIVDIVDFSFVIGNPKLVSDWAPTLIVRPQPPRVEQLHVGAK
ncbi:hypothetical protein [Marinobacter sp. ELB17]|uniref:hypothetical protein n=1 Tax=Marinobacter sp. ELB17 TaxID=270374 RepID=UPI0000F39C61|nr:hypothetical protein [Marinobacter sp. ELB17]EAZ97240.1 hypothetical protein MELB17_10123 [Marinobacter sp. ELB17]